MRLITDHYCKLDEWEKYWNGDGAKIGDVTPIDKPLDLLVDMINDTFNGELVLRFDVSAFKKLLYVFRPPKTNNGAASTLSPLATSGASSTQFVPSNVAESTQLISIFQQSIRDEIKSRIKGAKFDFKKGLIIKNQSIFLDKLAQLFSHLENGCKQLLITWGPGGIGDVSDFTVQPCEYIKAIIYSGGIVEGCLCIQVSAVYCAAYKLNSGMSLGEFDYYYIRNELNLSNDQLNDKQITNLINACLMCEKLRFETK
jgi:hypothetical protein